jgi:Helix-turn-helix domain
MTYLTSSQVAAKVELSKSTVNRATRRGELKSITDNREVQNLYTPEAVNDWITTRKPRKPYGRNPPQEGAHHGQDHQVPYPAR